MAGDQVNARVNYYTPDVPGDNSDANGAQTLLAGLSTLLSGPSSPLPVKGAGEAVSSSLNNSSPFMSFMQPEQGDNGDGQIKAYLNIVFFDEQFHFVSTGSTAAQVSIKGTGANLTLPAPIEAVKNGYVYVYLSNESDNFVYFDQLQVIQQHGPLTEETHYYPFGLTMSAISSQALNFGDPGNKKKYNGIEFDEDFDIEEYEAYYRNLDPQIGRWWQVDPMCEASINSDIDDGDETTPEGLESISPYASMNDNPAKHADPLGNAPDDCCGTSVDILIGTQYAAGEANLALGGPLNPIADIVSGSIEVVGDLWALGLAIHDYSQQVHPLVLPAPPKSIITQIPPTVAPPKAITPPAQTVTAPPQAITPTAPPTTTTVNAHGQKKQSTGSLKKSGTAHMRQYKNYKKGNNPNRNKKKGADDRRLNHKPID